MSEIPPTFVDLDEAAAAVGACVTVRQLRARIAEGRLPANKVGRGYVVRIDDVLALYRPALHARTQRRAERPDPLAASGIGRRTS